MTLEDQLEIIIISQNSWTKIPEHFLKTCKKPVRFPTPLPFPAGHHHSLEEGSIQNWYYLYYPSHLNVSGDLRRMKQQRESEGRQSVGKSGGWRCNLKKKRGRMSAWTHLYRSSSEDRDIILKKPAMRYKPDVNMAGTYHHTLLQRSSEIDPTAAHSSCEWRS